jgi:type VI protein secretion system component VasK
MSTSIAIPTTIQIKRNRLLALVTAVAVLAAAITWIIVHFAFDANASAAASSAQPVAPAFASSATIDAGRVPSLMSLSPARLAAGALGTGYALPTAHQGPTLASVLASMSPQTRRYTKAVTSLTFAQLAAGAAGHP